MKGLTDVPGILVGHATDPNALTGCTAILCGTDAVGGVDVRGSATGSVELDTLDPGHVAGNVHAIVLAGARMSAASREFVDSAAAMRHGGVGSPAFRGNTTLAVVATNARLDRVQTNKLAALASIGVARTIAPVNTISDGDITFALSLGKEQASVDSVGAAASEALGMAILRAVRAARSAGGVPGLGG
jgi:L-aminopeptidase/D-esterase-like protein